MFLKRYPFYGVQFHPEKNVYEWIRNRNISHTENAIKMTQYFARFFVHESRKNANKFSGVDEENRMLIYNFPVTFTALVKSAFEQSYLFTETVQYGNGSIITCKCVSISMLKTVLGLLAAFFGHAIISLRCHLAASAFRRGANWPRRHFPAVPFGQRYYR